MPGSSDMFTDTETVERIKSSNLAGKIVLSEGGGRQNDYGQAHGSSRLYPSLAK